MVTFAVCRGSRRVLAGAEARLRPRQSPDRVDVEPLHPAEIEDDATLAGPEPGDAMCATADGELEAGLAGEEDRAGDVGGR